MQVSVNRDIKTNVTNSVDFSVSTDSAKLFSMLSTALYTDKEKAVCYELGANCYDANPDKAFAITAPTTLDSHVRFRDYGPGLAEHDVYRLLTVYGASEKQNNPSAIGGYGIGAKSPAAVTDTWTVVSHHGGKMMEFLVFINEHGIPSLTKIREAASNETGLEVVIPVAQNRFSSWNIAFAECFKHYPIKPTFKNINVTYSDVTYKIKDDVVGFGLRNVSFGNYDSKIKFITTHREYSVDIEKLKVEFKDDKMLIALLNWPLTLEFKFGDLQLSLSRESIQYTKFTVSNIHKRLTAIKSHFMKLIGDHLDSAKDGFEYRQKLFELNSVIGQNVLDSTGSSFIMSVVNGKYNITNFHNDIKHLKVSLPCGSDVKSYLRETKYKMYNGRSVVSILNTNFTCFKSYAVKVDYEYINNVEKHSFRFAINMMDKVQIVINDVRDTVARVKHSFSINKNSKYILIASKNIFPAELNRYIVKASTLPKAPRQPRSISGTNTKNIVSDFYILRSDNCRSFTKVENDYITNTCGKSKVALVEIKDARQKSSMILEHSTAALETLQTLGYTPIFIKQGKHIPKGFKTADEILKSEWDKFSQTDVENMFALESYRQIEWSYEAIIKIVRSVKYKTNNNSVWNKIQDKIEDIRVKSKRAKCGAETYLNLARVLEKTPATNSFSLDKMKEELYNTYEMFKIVNYSSDSTIIKNYLELVGK